MLILYKPSCAGDETLHTRSFPYYRQPCSEEKQQDFMIGTILPLYRKAMVIEKEKGKK